MEIQFLNYFLMSIIAALGLAGGYFLGKIAKEELKSGEKYFKLTGHIILSLIALIYIYFLSTYKILQFILFALVITAFIIIKIRAIKTALPAAKWIFSGLGFIFYSSPKNIILIGALIFIYGLPIGTLAFFNKEPKKIILPIALFIVVSNILYLFF